MNFSKKHLPTYRPISAWAGLRLVLARLAYLAFFSGSALAQTSYNFNWNFAGDEDVTPVQIFDDGQHVYLQFSQGAEVPAVFAETPAGPLLLSPEKRSPYMVVNSLETKLSFRLQDRTARAWRSTTSAAVNPAPEAVATGLAAPSSSISGLAVPIVMNGSAQVPVSPAQIASRRTDARGAAMPTPSTHTTSIEAVPLPPLVPTTKTEAQTIPATGSIAPTIASPAFIPEAPPVGALTPEQGPTERYRITLGATMPTPTRPPGPALATPASVSSPDIKLDVPIIQVSEVSTPSAPATVGTVNITQNSNTSSEGALATTDVLPVTPATWSARAGMRLSELIAEWGRQQGWTVRWDTQLDYLIEAAFDIQSESFLEAANEVFGAYQNAEESFYVTAYANNVLIVKGLKK